MNADDLVAIEARPPLMARHDDGCQCWPHVTEADAIEAVRLEYLEGRKAVAAERARIAEAVRGLPCPWPSGLLEWSGWLRCQTDVLAIVEGEK